MAAKSKNPGSKKSVVAPVVLKSCLKRYDSAANAEARQAQSIYSSEETEFGPEREARILEWNKNYSPGIITCFLRNRRRSNTLNPHFLPVSKKTKAQQRKLDTPRVGIIEIALQNGLGARYRLVSSSKGQFDFPMKCVAKVIYGCGCCICSTKLRTEATLKIVEEWDTYKWEVKYCYSYYITFFRTYDPFDIREKVHERAKFLYKVAVLEDMYDSTRLEIGLACELHEVNFYCIEALDPKTFEVSAADMNFEKSIYFFAKEIPYEGRMRDKHNDLYENYYYIWLRPANLHGKNLKVQSGLLHTTYSNTEIGFFHLSEDPFRRISQSTTPGDSTRSTPAQSSTVVKRHRKPVIRFAPIVHVLLYYQPRSFRLSEYIFRALGIWPEAEVDIRILRYNKMMVTRFHELDQEFIRISEIAAPLCPVDNEQIVQIGRTLEEYLSHLKNPSDEDVKLNYQAKKIRDKFVRKFKRNRQRLEMISHRFYKGHLPQQQDEDEDVRDLPAPIQAKF